MKKINLDKQKLHSHNIIIKENNINLNSFDSFSNNLNDLNTLFDVDINNFSFDDLK